MSNLRVLSGSGDCVVLAASSRDMIMQKLGKVRVDILFEHVTKLDAAITGVAFMIKHGSAPSNIDFKTMEKRLGEKVRFYKFEILRNLNISTCGRDNCSELRGYIISFKGVELEVKVY